MYETAADGGSALSVTLGQPAGKLTMLLRREERVGDIRHGIEGGDCQRFGWRLKTTCFKTHAAAHEECEPSPRRASGDNDLALFDCVLRLAQEGGGAKVVHDGFDVRHDPRHAGLGGQAIIRGDEAETVLLRRRDEVGPRT
jgi:hypothetical protein